MLRLYYCLRNPPHHPSSATATWFSPGGSLSGRGTPSSPYGHCVITTTCHISPCFFPRRVWSRQASQNKKGRMNAALEAEELVSSWQHLEPYKCLCCQDPLESPLYLVAWFWFYVILLFETFLLQTLHLLISYHHWTLAFWKGLVAFHCSGVPSFLNKKDTTHGWQWITGGDWWLCMHAEVSGERNSSTAWRTSVLEASLENSATFFF